jgi:hypothetical protein
MRTWSRKYMRTSRLFAVGTTIALGLSLVSCKPENTPGEADACHAPFETTVTADVSQGGHKFSFPLDQLDFLSSPDGFDLIDVELQATVKGRHDTTEDIELSLNGIKVSRRDGRHAVDALDYLEQFDRSLSHFKLHKMFLNGAMPFPTYLGHVKARKGELVVGLHTRKALKVVEADLVFKGTTAIECPDDPPPPPPDPKPDPAGFAAHINSVNPSESPTTMTSLGVTFSSQLSGGSFYCSLDQAQFTLCGSPQAFANLTSGAHLFQVYGKTPDGIVSGTPASYSWIVDAIAPVVTITNSSNLPTLTSSNAIAFAFVSTEPGQFICSVDGLPAVDCQSPASFGSLADGLHVFTVSARDLVGNVSGQAGFQWTIDSTPPVTTLLEVSPAQTITNQNSAFFSFSANESAGFECAIDAASFSPCVSPVSLNSLNEGAHWFEVRAVDLAGNVSLASTYSWTVDQTAPVITLGVVLPNPGLSNSTGISVEFASSEAASLACAFDGAPSSPCSSPFLTQNLSEGQHTLALSPRT